MRYTDPSPGRPLLAFATPTCHGHFIAFIKWTFTSASMCLSNVLQRVPRSNTTCTFMVLHDHAAGRLIGFSHPLLRDGLYLLGDLVHFLVTCVACKPCMPCLLGTLSAFPWIQVRPRDARYGLDCPRYGEYYGVVWHRSWYSTTIVP